LAGSEGGTADARGENIAGRGHSVNPKQVGALLVMAGIFLAVQLGMMFQNKARDVDLEVEKARGEEKILQTQLNAEKDILTDLRRQSDELLKFVDKWRPFFALMREKQSAETGISMKVREEAMLTLSQRYQEIPHKINNKDNQSLPVLIRATLLFDDSYSKLLNWFGNMEKIRPTMRVGRLALSKGSRGDDLRMELMLEVPLLKGGVE
jgi:hypothetical protein